MARNQKILLILTLIGVFVLVYSPHFFYPYPYHVDEWHHISEAVRFEQPESYFNYINQEPSRQFSGLEIGFHVFLSAFSKVTDLVLFYKFLPAIWAVFSAGILFYVIYKKTGGNYLLSWLGIVFFAAIRSNTNLTGLWFFTPLSFSIPFIFLYFYFFEKGITTGTRKDILIALLIMTMLIPFHPLSVLFSLPILLIYSIVHYRFWLKHKIVLGSILIAGSTGFIFYASILKLRMSEAWQSLLTNLIFRRGWGVFEMDNSIFQIYNWLAFALAVCGAAYLVRSKKIKENLLFLIWPAYLLLAVIFYKIFNFSFFSPFQRNLYYLAISLPLLSAYGVYFLFDFFKKKGASKITVYVFSMPLIFIILFSGYYKVVGNLFLYHVITDDDYHALKKLSEYEPAVVMADHFLSTALYPVSGHEPVGTIAFYGNRGDVEKFYYERYDDCKFRKKMLTKYQVQYYINRSKDSCDLGEFLFSEPGAYVYRVHK